jgi:hypothetical protein
VPTYPFSSFRRAQVTMEMRYDEAFLLWDRSGALWRDVERQFKAFKNSAATPNQSTFVADKLRIASPAPRYTVNRSRVDWRDPNSSRSYLLSVGFFHQKRRLRPYVGLAPAFVR